MNCLFLINPVSGGGFGINVARLLQNAPEKTFIGIKKEIIFIHPSSLEQQLILHAQNKDVISIVGGDGTVANVASYLAKLKDPPPIAIIPAGTGNDLANTLGWLRVWQEGRLLSFFSSLENSKRNAIDLWSINGTNTFINYVGLGLDARIVKRFSYMRKKLRRKIYDRRVNELLYVQTGIIEIIHSIRHKEKTPFFTISYQNGRYTDFHFKGTGTLLISNLPYYAGGGRLSPQSSFHDRVLEIYTFPTILSYLLFIIRSRLKISPGYPHFAQAKRIRIEGQGLNIKQVDGEFIEDCISNKHLFIDFLRSLPVLIPSNFIKKI